MLVGSTAECKGVWWKSFIWLSNLPAALFPSHIWRWSGNQCSPDGHSKCEVLQSPVYSVMILIWIDCFDQSEVERIQCQGHTYMTSVLCFLRPSLDTHAHLFYFVTMGSFHWFLLFLYWANNDIYIQLIHCFLFICIHIEYLL